MLFKAYFDESANQPETVFAVGGFVGPEQAWTELEPKWLEAIPSEVGYFHATDCFGGRNAFRGFSLDKRRDLLSKLTELTVGADIHLVAAGIDVEAYKEFAPKLKQNEFGGNKYVAPFSFAIELACKDYMNLDNPEPVLTEDVCDFYIEDGPWKAGAEIAVQDLKKFPHDRWWRDRIGVDRYGTKLLSVIPLLQVADFGVFLAEKIFTHAEGGPIPWRPYYERLTGARKVYGLTRIDQKSLDNFYGMYQVTKLDEAQIDDLWNTV